jgi:uncharacterized protein (UPF0261 family)
MPVYLLATCDSKGVEAGFVRDQLRALGVAAQLVDTGSHAPPVFVPDVTREALLSAVGMPAIPAGRGDAVRHMATAVAEWIAREHAAGRVDGVLGIGGSAGTTIGTAAMRRLPVGVPKVMVSTLASSNVRAWVGDKDILMLNSIVDLVGINRISRTVLGEAARAMAGLVKSPRPAESKHDKPLIAATMFGVTTPCVQAARKILEDAGYEVLVFHATGNGGQAMESLIDEGLIAGVLDITTTELADELVGGVLSAGPDRLTAAGRRGVPQLISVGALDMVNFGPRDTVPAKWSERKFHIHNPSVTLMRTTVDENRKLGEEVGRKAAAATGPVRILLPLRGVSAIDVTGQSFDDPAARAALFAGIDATANPVPVEKRDEHINDPAFAAAAAHALLEMIQSRRPS